MTPRVLPYVLLALLAGVVSYALADTYRRGHADGMADGAARSVRERVRVVRVLDTLYIRDTVRFARWRDRWDSVRVTDTVTVRDVVYVPRDLADSTISACRAVIASCERRVAARDSLIVALNASLKAERAARPSGLRVALDRAVWAAAGVGVGVLVGVTR
jgi:hypothetical protein